MVTAERPAPGEAYWVFGYGSLMWRPGFPFSEAHDAVLEGYTRSFCIYSFHHRGTADSPGLVLGLDVGGECLGRIFRVDAADADAVTAYLDERELVNYPYISRFLPVEARMEGTTKTVAAYTFIADTGHPDYAGRMPLRDAATLIMQASGIAGLNRDYLMNTVQHLESAGFVDQHLHDLLREIEARTGVLDMGSGI
ncbi:MAG: gamma-glutamylcyclotransferase [Rhodospirillales bacterium]